jgi:hypothetical protein
MSVREVSSGSGSKSADAEEGSNEEKEAMDAEAAQQDADARAEQLAEDEEEQAAHSSARYAANAKRTKKSKKQLREEEKDRQRKEWQAKWVPLVSSIRVPVSAVAPLQPGEEAPVVRQPSLCLNVKRHVRDRSKLYKPTTTAVKVYFPLFGISVIDSAPEEVVYLSLTGVGCSFNDSQWQTTLSATVTSIQLDNLLRQAVFPVVFNPSIIQGAVVPQPFIQVALNKKKQPAIPRMSIFPYFSLLVQKMDVRVEELNIWRTLAFVNQMALRFSGEVTADLDSTLLTRRFSEMIVAPTAGKHKMYFKLLRTVDVFITHCHAMIPPASQPCTAQRSRCLAIHPVDLFGCRSKVLVSKSTSELTHSFIRSAGRPIPSELGS